MANTFKVKTNDAMPGTSGDLTTGVLYTTPGTATNTKSIVLGLILCNVHTSQVTVSVQLVSNTADTETNANVYLLKNVPVPAGSSLEVLAGNKVVLQGTDVLRIDCSVSAKIDAALSIMEIT